MTYYGRWTYKYEEAARQGALGMLVVHETEPASYGWATVRNSNATAMFDIVRENPAAPPAPADPPAANRRRVPVVALLALGAAFGAVVFATNFCAMG